MSILLGVLFGVFASALRARLALLGDEQSKNARMVAAAGGHGASLRLARPVKISK
jgi:hypothetical protein